MGMNKIMSHLNVEKKMVKWLLFFVLFLGVGTKHCGHSAHCSEQHRCPKAGEHQGRRLNLMIQNCFSKKKKNTSMNPTSNAEEDTSMFLFPPSVMYRRVEAHSSGIGLSWCLWCSVFCCCCFAVFCVLCYVCVPDCDGCVVSDGRCCAVLYRPLRRDECVASLAAVLSQLTTADISQDDFHRVFDDLKVWIH